MTSIFPSISLIYTIDRIIKTNTKILQMLIVLWMTRSITDDIPGWGALFEGRAGDGTVSVSIYIYNPSYTNLFNPFEIAMIFVVEYR